MYESELNQRVDSASEIPSDILEKFSEVRRIVVARSVLPWSEHCTECTWPSCFTTCEFYTPRRDLKCQRFADGMVRIEHPEGLTGYILKIRFRKWGKLFAWGSTKLYPVPRADSIERRDRTIGRLIQSAPAPYQLQSMIMRRRYTQKRVVARRARTLSHAAPATFLLECFNPQDHFVELSMTTRAQRDDQPISFQKLMRLEPGYNRITVPVSEISRTVDLKDEFYIDLTPDCVEEGVTLFFGTMDFVIDVNAETSKPTKCKCVVWDLDNTLWEGTLVEDGPNNIKLNQAVVDVITALDSRGILSSISSKNDPDETLTVLGDFGILEYFLYPQVSWTPKSRSINEIATALNVGRDTLIFVDDSAFERAEVASAYPEIKTLDPTAALRLPEMAECQVTVTPDSARRREYYTNDSNRKKTRSEFDGDYHSFLKSCNIQLTIKPLTEEDIQRAHELTQRTNQLNFSGNRYDRDVLIDLLHTDSLRCYVLDCKDKFGSYGTIGFSVIDHHNRRMTDLMFSCRVQGKRVEHAFLTFLLEKYGAGEEDFFVTYKRTKRNAVSGKVFEDFGFEQVREADGLQDLVFPRGRDVQNDRLINVVELLDDQMPK